MKRIAVLSDLWLPFPGGAERYMFNVARDLMHQGNEVDVLTGYAPAQVFDGPPVYVRPDVHTRDRIEDGWQVVSEFAAVAMPDVWIVHQHWAYEFGERLAESRPVVQMVYNGARIPSSSLAVYISDFTRGHDRSARPSDLTLLPWADPADVVPVDGPRDCIGFVKPLEHKGIRFLYDLARGMPDRQFLVLRGEWQPLEIIEELPNVEFMEPVDDMRDFWRRVWLVLVPSISEDAGTVAQEATANGIVCISSNVGGLPETNRGGIRMKRFDLGDWADIIDHCGTETFRESWLAMQRAGTPQPRQVLDELAARIDAL